MRIKNNPARPSREKISRGMMRFLKKPAAPGLIDSQLLRLATIPEIGDAFGWIYLAILLAGLIYGLAQSAGWPLFHDTAIFHYIAWRISQGAVPYRDILDINMPGVYLVHLLALKLFGESDAGFRLFDLSTLALACAGIAAFCWQSSKRFAFVAALLFANFHLWMGAFNTGQRDFLLTPLLIFAALFLARFLESSKRRAGLFACGLLLGFGCWIKPVVAVLACAFLVFLWRWPMAGKTKLIAASLMAAGAATASAGVVYWLHQAGAWDAFMDMLNRLLPAYSQSSHSVTRYLKFPAGAFYFVIITLSLTALLQAHFLHTDWRKDRVRHLVVALGVVYGLAHFYLQMKGLPYHLYPLALFLCTLAGLMLSGLNSKDLRFNAGLYLAFIFACLIANPLIKNTPPDIDMPAYSQTVAKEVERAYGQVPAAVKRQSGPSLQFFDFTYAKLWNVAFRQHWVPASRQIHYFALIPDWNTPYVEQMRQEFYDEMTTKKPWVILFPKDPPDWVLADAKVFDRLNVKTPWREWFAAHYSLFSETDLYWLYVRTR